jgi:shikimate dehydrogenase
MLPIAMVIKTKKPTAKYAHNQLTQMNYPTVTTKFIILLGNPLGHSISPAMHNRVFEKLGLDYCYLPVQVEPQNLETVFAGLSKMNVAGFNVTIPHKINIIEHLDRLDPLAATIGAVNTICIKDGKTTGHNTDGEGFIRTLEEEGEVSVPGKKIFLLGGGGAARSIAMTLAYRGAEMIFICNRTLAKAEALAAEINKKIRNCAKAVPMLNEQVLKTIQSCDILVNSTNVGMHPRQDVLPLSEDFLFSHLVVADIVYNPHTTKLLATAKARGCRIVHGLGMLIYQGAAGFKLWTGIDPLISEMTEVAYDLMVRKK